MLSLKKSYLFNDPCIYFRVMIRDHDCSFNFSIKITKQELTTSKTNKLKNKKKLTKEK